VVSLFTVLDVYEDWEEGASLYHIIPEAIVIFATLIIACFLFLRFAKAKDAAIRQAISSRDTAHASAKEWQNKASELKKGISQAISAQLKSWGLTEAEQDIAFLLIKGMSINEIAELRKTSQQTTRQQASVIYKKSDLAGRAQLSAFFLEDLLLDIEIP
jgi:DNA-binding CsgD family transcriptional regulator